jgi:hypothetical protein
MKSKNSLLSRSVAILVMVIAVDTMAHGGHHHPQATMPSVPPPQMREAAEVINEMYQREVQPIFEKKCFDCHSSRTKFPWYYKVPGIKQMIDEDIDEAKAHLDFEPGFPFKSHGTPEEDLKAIAQEVEENEMPPLSYKLMHRGSHLTPSEKEKVQAWVQFGLEKLKP